MFEYNPLHIIPSWGHSVLSGFFDGTFVLGSRDEDAVLKHAGSKGDITATLNANQSGSIVVTLVQGSETNAELLAALFLQEKTGKLQKRPFSITDLAGSMLVTAPNAWIRKPTDANFAKEAGPREWIFDCDRLIYLPGTPLL